MPIQPGGHLGAYRIDALLGQGGMGTVYRAFDTTLQRPVAIKVLSEADDQARGKLLAEARATSALDHPNICTVHEVGEADGQPYIVMALVEGKPLSELIPSDGLPPETVIRYGLQIADALAHAHEKGIVHRDLKSQNVVITPEGRAKVLDFGLATRLEKQDAEAVTVSLETQAAPATVAGTLAYMAPEVLRGDVPTARSDIWALGTLLYEMAAGALPFGGTTRTDIVSAIVKETPRALSPRVPPGLRSIIQRCLTKEHGQRYAGAGAVHAALEAIQSDTAATQRVIETPAHLGRSRRVAIAAGVLFLVSVAALLLRSSEQPASRPIPRLVNPQQITLAVGREGFPALSPDGQLVAYEVGRGSVGSSALGVNRDIYVARVGGGEPVNRTADFAGSDMWPSWSPDGEQLAFWSERDGGSVLVMPVLAGPPRRIAAATAAGRANRPQWTPDGHELLYLVQDDNLVVAEAHHLTSGDTRRFPLPGPSEDPARVPGGVTGRADLSLSPDGRFLAYVLPWHSWQVTQLWVLRLEDGEAFPLTDYRTYDHSPSWTPDARALYFVSNRGGSRDLWLQRLDEDGHPVGEPEAISAGLGMAEAQLSSDGTQLVYAKGGPISNVWRVPILHDRPATWDNAEQVTFDEAFIEHQDVSPNGEQLVINSDRRGNPDLWILPSGGGEMRQLTTDVTPDWGPRWSPDGQHIVFYSFRSGNRDIWTIPASGGTARQVTRHEALDRFPFWSPDGRQIAFHSQREEPRGIWVIPTDGGEARRVARFGNGGSWSPGGEWIAVGGNPGPLLVPVAGGEPEAVTDMQASAARWSADGRDLFFLSPDETGMRQFWVVSLEDRQTRKLTDLSSRAGFWGLAGTSTDGEHLYFIWGEEAEDIWVMDVVQDEQ